MNGQGILWHSEEVTLREISVEDAEYIVLWRSDPQVYRYFKEPRKITLHQHIQWFKESYCLNNNRVDFIVLDSDQAPVGTVGVIWDEGSKTAEVSYLIAPEHRGKGLASKALYALCAFAKKRWDVDQFTACIHQQNLPSQKFIEAQGFAWVKNEDEFRIYQKHR